MQPFQQLKIMVSTQNVTLLSQLINSVYVHVCKLSLILHCNVLYTTCMLVMYLIITI